MRGNLLHHACRPLEESWIDEAVHGGVHKTVECPVILRIEIDPVRLAEFGEQDQRGKSVQVIVQGTRAALQLEREGSVGLNPIYSVGISLHPPVEIILVVGENADGGDLDARPVKVIISIAVTLFPGGVERLCLIRYAFEPCGARSVVLGEEKPYPRTLR